MPLYGVRDVAPLLDHAAVIDRLDTEPVTLPGVEILYAQVEIETAPHLDLLPPALHPTIPPSATFIFWKCAEGPFGPFTLAQVRVGCRAGVRPRGFVTASYCDSQEASEALRSRWGYNCRPGIVRLRRYYDRVVGSVVAADETILQVTLLDPQPMSGAEVMYTASMQLARIREGEARDRLVQVDPEYTFRRADRGRPSVDTFDAGAWAAEGLRPNYMISATATQADVALPRHRYLVDPNRPAMQGTETLTH